MIAGIVWKKNTHMLWYNRDRFIEPPGYQATPFKGILVSIAFLPISIMSVQDTLISAELVKLYTLRFLKNPATLRDFELKLNVTYPLVSI